MPVRCPAIPVKRSVRIPERIYEKMCQIELREFPLRFRMSFFYVFGEQNKHHAGNHSKQTNFLTPVAGAKVFSIHGPKSFGDAGDSRVPGNIL